MLLKTMIGGWHFAGCVFRHILKRLSAFCCNPLGKHDLRHIQPDLMIRHRHWLFAQYCRAIHEGAGRHQHFGLAEQQIRLPTSEPDTMFGMDNQIMRIVQNASTEPDRATCFIRLDRGLSRHTHRLRPAIQRFDHVARDQILNQTIASWRQDQCPRRKASEIRHPYKTQAAPPNGVSARNTAKGWPIGLIRLTARLPLRDNQPGEMPRNRSDRRRRISTVVSSRIEMITRIVATDRIAGEICSRIPFHI